MAFNSRTERESGPAGNGIAGLVSANAAMRPFGPCRANKRAACGKNLVACAGSRRLVAPSPWDWTELFRIVGCSGVFTWRVEVSGLVTGFGEWPSPVSRREPRGAGSSDLGPSDVSLTLLRPRALAGKGRERDCRGLAGSSDSARPLRARPRHVLGS